MTGATATTLAPWVLALALGAGLANTTFHLAYHQSPLYLDPRALVGRDRRAVLGGRQVAALLVALGGLAVFLLTPVPELGAALALAAILQLRRWEIATWPGDVVVRLGKYAPASACLLGWAAAHLIARALGADAATQAARGWDAAAGVLASAYVLAAIAKVRESGLGWTRAESISLLLAERGFGRWGGLRLRLAQSRFASAFVGWMGLLVEAAAVLLLFPPIRPYFAAGIVVFMAVTWLLFGYFEPEWALGAAAIGIASAG